MKNYTSQSAGQSYSWLCIMLTSHNHRCRDRGRDVEKREERRERNKGERRREQRREIVKGEEENMIEKEMV